MSRGKIWVCEPFAPLRRRVWDGVPGAGCLGRRARDGVSGAARRWRLRLNAASARTVTALVDALGGAELHLSGSLMWPERDG